MVELQKVKKVNYEMNIARNENKKELDLIQEAFEKNVEVLLGSMTETSFELEDILEETDQTVETYKNDNDDLRQKIWKSIKKIREKDDEINKWKDEVEMISDENEELREEIEVLKKEISEMKRKYEQRRKEDGTCKSKRDKCIVRSNGKR